MEPIQVHPPPDHYAGLGIQEPGVALDQHGYFEVIADSERDDQPRVCTEIARRFTKF